MFKRNWKKKQKPTKECSNCTYAINTYSNSPDCTSPKVARPTTGGYFKCSWIREQNHQCGNKARYFKDKNKLRQQLSKLFRR